MMMSTSITAQGIRFISNDLDQAMLESQTRQKPLFIDTYASWCVQCKKMDAIFKDPEVANFFNKNFINLKVDMGVSQYAYNLKKAYDVIFLPTMIILDENGRVKYMVDRVLSKYELMEVARKVANPGVYLENDVVGINKTPIDDSTERVDNTPSQREIIIKEQEEIIDKTPESIVVENIPLPKRDDSKDKILYVLEDEADLPAEVLYQEAYFRMTLMDGSQTKVAKKYLKTQNDWSSDINIRFINDFVVSTDSDMFNFMLANRHKFETLLGVEHVARTIQILVYRKLYQGIPRPDFEESEALLSYINPKASKIEALTYYLERMYQEADYDQYLHYATDYLINVNAKDHLVYYRLAYIGSLNKQSMDEVNISIDQINQAITLHDTDADYFHTKAALLLKKGDKVNAQKAADKCVKLCMKNGESLTDINLLISKIKSSRS